MVEIGTKAILTIARTLSAGYLPRDCGGVVRGARGCGQDATCLERGVVQD